MLLFRIATCWTAVAVCAMSVFVPAAAAQDAAPETDSVERDYADELPRIPSMEPDEAQGAFEIHDGFRMDLIAAEPLVYDPVAASYDEDGRLYVVEMRGYSEQKDENLSDIRLLEDTDGDGKFDKSTVFLANLTWPVAVFCYDGGVFVGVPPEILYAKDTDGDGVADDVKPVFTGFSLSNVQGLLNSFIWGPDNRIYAAVSSSGAELTRADDPSGPALSLRGRDFSFDPRTLDFRAESGGAQHGMSFDNWYHRFASMNSDHIQLYMIDDRYLARNPYLSAPTPRISIASDGPSADVYRISPVEPWRIVRTRLRVKGIVPGPVEGGGTASGYFTSATGVTIYRGDAWPAEYHGNAFIADVGSNLIHRKTLTSNGVELVANRADAGTEFIRSTDIWFRPVQFYNTPDGNLMALDMYRETIEHPASLPEVIKKHLDLTSGRDRGRLYRITPEGFEQPKPVKLSEATTAELVALLDHPNAWHRETAARLIYQRQDQSVAGSLRALAKGATIPEGRMHALYTLSGLGVLTADDVLPALDDAHPQVRRHALRLAEPLLKDSEALQQKLAAMTSDDDPEVRYQLAFSLGEGPSTSDRNTALAAIAKSDSGNKWFDTAIMSSVTLGAGEVFAALMDDATYRTSDAGKGLLAELARQTGATGSETELAAALQKVDALPAEEDGFAQTAVTRIIAGLQVAGRGGEATRILAQSTRAGALLNAMLASARADAVKSDADVAQRVSAIGTLAFDAPGEAVPLLSGLLDQHEPAEVQAAALAALRGYEDPAVAQTILTAWPTLSPSLRLQAVEALFSRKPWLEALLDAIADESFNPKSLESTRIRALQTSADPAIKSRAENLLGNFDFSARQAVVDAYRPALDLKGDREHGKKVFMENCAQCHKVEGQGHDVGPNLVTVAQAGAEKILMNVLDPNSEINPQYVNYTIDTDDFQTHSGIIGSETATSITLKRANGDSSTILRVNIENIRSENMSIMPEGLEQTIDQQSMADLIAYLTSVE